MSEPKVTASAVISFARKLEEDSSSFYEQLAEKFLESKGEFLFLAKESKKNMVLVTRTYQETITDAFETGFSFNDMSLDHYIFDTTLTSETRYSEALEKAIQLEEKAGEFYLEVAERSESLLGTIPNAFRKVAEKRNTYKLRLKSLLDNLSSDQASSRRGPQNS